MVAAQLRSLLPEVSRLNGTATGVSIDVLSPARYEDYERFLLSRPDTLVYQSIRFKDFLRALLDCGEEYLIATRDGELCGALPLLHLDGPTGRVYNSLPYYGSNGGIIASDRDTYAELLGAWSEIVRQGGVAAATIVTNPFDDVVGPPPPHDMTDVRISQATLLPAEADDPGGAIAASIDSSARRNVAKARKEGVRVETDPEAMFALEAMHLAGMNAIGGLAKTSRFFELVGSHFRPGSDYDLYVAKKDGTPIAALLLFYFNRTVEYYTPASDPEARSFQPLGAVLLDAMSAAARRGFTRWNWGGTWQSQGGVYRFKKKWGAVEKEYLYYTVLRDESLFGWSPAEITATYPGFFVLPFSRLTGER
jgi:CelD/BcsL family acetyltransferase involved in cellulose biosynthesis